MGTDGLDEEETHREMFRLMAARRPPTAQPARRLVGGGRLGAAGLVEERDAGDLVLGEQYAAQPLVF